MLVLSRQKNESVVINDDIEITIVEIRGDKVRLGIISPPDVPVHRREVFDAIRRAERKELPPGRSEESPPQEERLAPLRRPRRDPGPMLVISRKKNESIVIDDDICIVVVEIRGDKVRLGVELPRTMSLHRKEVLDAIRRNEQSRKPGDG